MDKKPPSWWTIEAKCVLQEDILSGRVGADMTAEDVYVMYGQLYQQYAFPNFKNNFKNHREAVEMEIGRMELDCAGYFHDKDALSAAGRFDPSKPVPWHKSEAKELLKQDIDAGKHLEMKPIDLRDTREVYKLFELEVFRKHISQEARRREKRRGFRRAIN